MMADIMKDDPWSYGVVETWSSTRGNEENRESLLKCTFRLSLYLIITKNIFTFILPSSDTHVTTLYGYSLEQIQPCNAFVIIIIYNRILYNIIIMIIWSRGSTIVLRRLQYNEITTTTVWIEYETSKTRRNFDFIYWYITTAYPILCYGKVTVLFVRVKWVTGVFE